MGIGSAALGVHAAGISSNGSNGTGHIANAAAVGSSGNGSAPARGGSGGSAAAARTAQTGLVFQFPERHFLVGPSIDGCACGPWFAGCQHNPSCRCTACIVTWWPCLCLKGSTVGEELTFGWPQRPEDMFTRQQMALRLNRVGSRPECTSVWC